MQDTKSHGMKVFARSRPALTDMRSAIRRSSTVIVLTGAIALVAGGDARSQTIVLDDFESELRVVQPDQNDPQFRFLWNQYDAGSANSGPGEAKIADVAHAGTGGLTVTVRRGNLYVQFYPHDGRAWHFMREFTHPADAWKMNTFNRMRLWVKAPPEIDGAEQGAENVQFGTYVRRSNGQRSSAEDGGNHYYHFFNVPYTGQWHQLVVDMHPSHVRGASGGTEHGDMPHPTRETDYNYFDLLTRFYLTFLGRLQRVPVQFGIDSVELYHEPRPENTAQIYSLNAVYVPTTNRLRVGWMRNKNENSVKHEVRYAFQDVFETGWDRAEPAPSGLIAPLGWQGYNGMEWSTDDIDLTGRSVIYIAVKPENSQRFRQIAIPLNGGAIDIPLPGGAPDDSLPGGGTDDNPIRTGSTIARTPSRR